MSYGLPRRTSGALESSPGWAEALGGILGTVGSFMQAKQQRALQQQELARQKAQDDAVAQTRGLQNALTRGQLTSLGLDDQGNQRPDPYVQQQQAQPLVQDAPTQGQPGDSDAALRGFSQQANPEDQLKQHVLALLGAGMVARAAPYQQQLATQQTASRLKAQDTRQGMLDARGQITFDQGQQDRAAAQAASDQATALAATVNQFRTGLQLPKTWNKMSGTEKVAYLEQRQTAAQKIGDTQTFDQTSKMITQINGPEQKGLDREARQQAAIQAQAAAAARGEAAQAAAFGRLAQLIGAGDERQTRAFEQQMTLHGLNVKEQRDRDERLGLGGRPGRNLTPQELRTVQREATGEVAAAIKQGAPRDAVVKRFAAKHNLGQAQADAMVPR